MPTLSNRLPELDVSLIDLYSGYFQKTVTCEFLSSGLSNMNYYETNFCEVFGFGL